MGCNLESFLVLVLEYHPTYTQEAEFT